MIAFFPIFYIYIFFLRHLEPHVVLGLKSCSHSFLKIRIKYTSAQQSFFHIFTNETRREFLAWGPGWMKRQGRDIKSMSSGTTEVTDFHMSYVIIWNPYSDLVTFR